MPLTDYSIHPLHAHTFSAEGGEGGGVEPATKFSKRGLHRTSTFKGGVAGNKG